MKEKLMKKIKKFLASPTFLIICILLTMASFFGSYVIKFDNSVKFQTQALQEIQSTQKSVDALTTEVTALKTNNEKLKQIICNLQKQVESLGATPVESLEECVL